MGDKRLIIACVIGTFVLGGCAVGFMGHSTFDPKTGKRTQTTYSPLFSSDSFPLAEGVELRVSMVITRRVEPVSYSLLRSIGGLPPEDMESAATAVVHFKNDSAHSYRIGLKTIKILNKEFSVHLPEITLKPGERFDTKSIPIKMATYDIWTNLDLTYELDGTLLVQNFPLRRQTMEELKWKGGTAERRYRERWYRVPRGHVEREIRCHNTELSIRELAPPDHLPFSSLTSPAPDLPARLELLRGKTGGVPARARLDG